MYEIIVHINGDWLDRFFKVPNWAIGEGAVVADAVSESKKAVSTLAAAIVVGIGLFAALLQWDKGCFIRVRSTLPVLF